MRWGAIWGHRLPARGATVEARAAGGARLNPMGETGRMKRAPMASEVLSGLLPCMSDPNVERSAVVVPPAVPTRLR